MAIFYSEVSAGEGGAPSAPYHRWNATKHYLTHYDNYLALNFIATSTSDRIERAQATKELTIAEKKLEYWKRHPNFVLKEALAGIEALKKRWETGR